MFSSKKSLAILITNCQLFCLLCSTNTVAAEIEIFKKPPSPHHLANILFPPLYRSANAPADNIPKQFGMMINFEHNSTKVLPESVPMLDSVGQMLNLEAIQEEVLVIEGHADASGTERHNEELSVRRAKAIKTFLIDGYNVDAGRIVTVGYGESELHDAGTPTNPINRRVEFRSINEIVVH